MAEGQATQRLNSLDVWLGDVPVGRIMRAAGGGILFAFGESYAEMPERPVLSQCYEAPDGEVWKKIRSHPGHLPPFFENLLPEGVLKDILAKRANVDPSDQLTLLGALGEDLPGAVRAFPSSPDRGFDPALNSNALAPNTNALRFSLAGVQLKLSACLKANGTLTIPATGSGGSWILKLPARGLRVVPENEYVMMSLARKVGIPVPHVELVPLESIAGLPHEVQDVEGDALAVKRFDRTADGHRVHMEDFAQVFGRRPKGKYGGHSYANMAAVLATVSGEQSIADFVGRVVFSALIGNGDMHLKNWSLLYTDPTRPILSPAYDFVSTIPYVPNEDLALGFGGSKNFADFDKSRIEKFAHAARIPFEMALSRCRDTAETTREAWRGHEERKLLPARMDALIDAMIQQVAQNVLGGSSPLKRRVVKKRIKAVDQRPEDLPGLSS